MKEFGSSVHEQPILLAWWPANKCCTFLCHNLVLVDCLCCAAGKQTQVWFRSFMFHPFFFFWPHGLWDQGLNPCPLHWKHRVLTTGPPGKSLMFHLKNFFHVSFKTCLNFTIYTIIYQHLFKTKVTFISTLLMKMNGIVPITCWAIQTSNLLRNTSTHFLKIYLFIYLFLFSCVGS